jgi:hypothetical protein
MLHQLNLYGFRDEDWPLQKPKDKTRVLFIGDSFVEGMMAAQGLTIPDRFEQLAEGSSQEIDAVNMGLAGVDMQQYLDLVRDGVALFQPDQVLLVLYANDFPPGKLAWSVTPLEPQMMNVWQPRLFYLLDRWRSRQPFAQRWSSAPFAFCAAVPSPTNPWSTPEYAKWFESFVEPSIAKAMQQGQFNPHAVNQYVFFEKRLREKVNMQPLIMAINSYISSRSAQLMVVYIPNRNQVSDAYLDYERQMAEVKQPTSLMGEQYQVHAVALKDACAKQGVAFLDMTADLRKEEDAGRHLFWKYDEHPSALGYSLLARRMFVWWQKNRR